MRPGSSRRIRVMSAVSVAAAALLVGKLYLVQIVHGSQFADKAERQYSKPNESLFDRGSIFFKARDGTEVTAAGLKSGFTVALNPEAVADPESLFKKLSGDLPLEHDAFIAKASKTGDSYEEAARRVSSEVAQKIAGEKLPGVSIFRERWRFYPGGRLAAHALGFVGSDGQTLAGRYGLERYYDDVLSRAGGSLYANFFAEIFGSAKQAAQGNGEGDVVTTIEPTVEQYLENALEDTRKRFDAKKAGGIVMDPKSGAIYAMALSPSFDPNEFGKEADPGVFSNLLVEGSYEMGSIMKPLTIASGLDAGVISATSTYYDAGFLTLNNKTIENYDGRGRGTVTMQEVLNQSLNTGAATVALKLGKERFRDYFLKFGLGEETGIDLPNEGRGLVRNLESGRDIEIATAAYGQGIAVTPIEMIRALSSLGNGGYLPSPHVASSIDYQIGISRAVGEGGARVQVIRPETAEEITRMLVEVVDKALGGGGLKFEHYSIAAKTGTALIANSESRGYYEDRFLHSFFGYFPAYDPRFIIFLFLIEPQGVEFASHTLAAPFLSAARFLINYYEIPPDR